MGPVGDVGHVGAEQPRADHRPVDRAADHRPTGRVPAELPERDDARCARSAPGQEGDTPLAPVATVGGPCSIARRSPSRRKTCAPGLGRGPQREVVGGKRRVQAPPGQCDFGHHLVAESLGDGAAVLGVVAVRLPRLLQDQHVGVERGALPTTSKGRPQPSMPMWTLKLARVIDAGRLRLGWATLGSAPSEGTGHLGSSSRKSGWAISASAAARSRHGAPGQVGRPVLGDDHAGVVSGCGDHRPFREQAGRSGNG